MPFRRWFPRTLLKQAQFYANFTRVFGETYEFLGFDEEDLASLQADNAVMQYLALSEVMVKSFKKAFRTFAGHITAGGEGELATYIDFTSPAKPPIVAPGMFERLFRLADKIVAADDYTTVIGAQLGILPKGGEPLRAEDLNLKLKTRVKGSAQIEIRFTRGRTHGVVLYFRRAGTENWIELGRFFSSPIIAKFPLLEDGKPEMIDLRGRYLIGNDPSGAFSAITSLNVTP